MTAIQIYGRYQAIRHQERIHTTLMTGQEVMFLHMINSPEHYISTRHKQMFDDSAGDSPVGSIFYERSGKILLIKCTEGWLGVTRFRLQGKSNDFTAADMVNTFRMVNFANPYFV